MHDFVTAEGSGRARTNAYITGECKDTFHRGLYLPSDNKMIPEQQDKVIEIIQACFE